MPTPNFLVTAFPPEISQYRRAMAVRIAPAPALRLEFVFVQELRVATAIVRLPIHSEKRSTMSQRLFRRKIFSLASTDAFAGAKVKQEADQRGDEAGERFDRLEA